jgi:hypothetical protein
LVNNYFSKVNLTFVCDICHKQDTYSERSVENYPKYLVIGLQRYDNLKLNQKINTELDKTITFYKKNYNLVASEYISNTMCKNNQITHATA